MKQKVAVILLVLSAIVCAVLFAQAQGGQQWPPPVSTTTPNPVMYAYTENNTGVIEIGTGGAISGGGTMPNALTSVAVRCISSGAVKVGANISYTIDNPNYIIVQSAMTQTDQKGRARLEIKANPATNIANMASTKIRFVWKDQYQQFVDTKSVKVIFREQPSTGSLFNAVTGLGLWSFRPNIEYGNLIWAGNNNENASVTLKIPIASTSWNWTNKINVQPGANPDFNWKIAWAPSSIAVGWYDDSSYPNSLYLNMGKLDGNFHYKWTAQPIRDFHMVMPLEWRHELDWIMSHEVGHGLGAKEDAVGGHSGADRYNSIMCPYTWGYHVGGVTAPSSADKTEMVSIY